MADTWLDTMRNLTSQRLTQAGQLRARQQAPVGAGGTRVSWGDPLDVNCRVIKESQSARIGVGGEQAQAELRWTIMLPWDVIANPGDQITVDGITYKVLDGGNEKTDRFSCHASVERVV